MKRLLLILLGLAAAATQAASADRPAWIPVLVPLTGIVALEGTSQRNGALLAIADAPKGLAVSAEVIDTGQAPESATNAFFRATSRGAAHAMVAPILGAQMLALLPLAKEQGIPLITISGTASITEQNNPFVFRFFPGDRVVKEAQARFAVEELKRSKPALIYQTTAYGQSGEAVLRERFEELGAPLVFAEGVPTTIRDLTPLLARLRESGADVLVLQLHAPTTALAVKQAAQSELGLPIVAGSAMQQPATAALLEPAELAAVCAETSAAPTSRGSAAMARFTDSYRKRFNAEPDAFAVAQYDGTMMALNAIAAGADTPGKVRDALANGKHVGLAMTYRSDGKGNMAHDAMIVCYDGRSRVPRIVKTYPGA